MGHRWPLTRAVLWNSKDESRTGLALRDNGRTGTGNSEPSQLFAGVEGMWVEKLLYLVLVWGVLLLFYKDIYV